MRRLHARSDGRAANGNQVASTLDTQSAQPPEGVPDVLYYQGPGSLGQIGGPQEMGQPLPGGMTPGAVPSALPNWSGAAAPADPSYSPSEAVPAAPLDISGTHNSATHYHGSAAFPGLGSLRSTVGPDASNMPPPAPASEAEPTLRPSPTAVPYNLRAIQHSTNACGIEWRRDIRPRPGRPSPARERQSDRRGHFERGDGRCSGHRAGDAPSRPGGSAMGTARHPGLTGLCWMIAGGRRSTRRTQYRVCPQHSAGLASRQAPAYKPANRHRSP